MFGPKQDNSAVGGVVSIFGRKVINGESPVIFGDGTQMRSFTYVDDLVNINKLVAMSDETKGEVYNCASGTNVTVQQLAEAVLTHFDRKDLEILYDEWTIGDIKIFDVSNEKIRDLGFEFKTDFETGLKLTLSWLDGYLKKDI